ncbi:helix-turn-helix transcriptional regulator [Niabella yanshanensis]|uniref:Helix-turn-helix transcriptional regulator n=1 Tax=Niabella yanshanensis TaxID=577386 RepID=A0ABZ0W6T1_9BACT|nr:helix-turn-helix transcriptional regulator [Niabella yanshanensis]WQD38901.1 helix-turn-helix transcriptional regulator [Niabella yanshanensis]
MEKKIHEGRNVKRFREMLGMKQEALASELGEDWNQKKISLLEQKETLDAAILKDVATALKIPVEAIQNFDEEQAINIISNNINNNDNAVMHGPALYNHYPTYNINPMEKWLESIEEIKQLYERWLKEKEQTIRTLEAILEHTRR